MGTMQIKFLADVEIERIREATLTVLAKTGVEFKGCPAARDIFAANGCRITGDRVHFPPEVVREGMALVPDREAMTLCHPGLGYSGSIPLKQGSVSFGLIGNAFTIHDYAAGEARNCIESDINDKLLVLDALPNLDYDCCNPLSPLKYKASEAQSIINGARSGHGMNQISPEVMWGATGPVTLAGSLVQHNAEVLAGVLLSQFASPGSACIYGCVSAPMDMHTTDTHHGGFETALFNAAVAQLADGYGLPSRLSVGNTSEVKPGPRAYAETAMGLYLGAAAGGTIITTGLLDSTILISYEHLVAVDELINQVRNTTKPIATDADSLAVEVIDRVCHGDGNFLADDHTLENMKRDVYYSAFTGRTQASLRDVYDTAHARVKEILSRRATDAHVEKDMLWRLETVETRLRTDDVTWRAGQYEWWTTYVEDL